MQLLQYKPVARGSADPLTASLRFEVHFLSLVVACSTEERSMSHKTPLTASPRFEVHFLSYLVAQRKEKHVSQKVC